MREPVTGNDEREGRERRSGRKGWRTGIIPYGGWRDD